MTAIAPAHDPGPYATYDPYASAGGRVAMHQLECAACGYEPEDQTVAPDRCPRCNGGSWRRERRPGALLDFQNRGGQACYADYQKRKERTKAKARTRAQAATERKRGAAGSFGAAGPRSSRPRTGTGGGRSRRTSSRRRTGG